MTEPAKRRLFMRAVNSHNALVEAVTELICWLPSEGGRTPAERGCKCPTLTEAIDKARAALALAEEGKP